MPEITRIDWARNDLIIILKKRCIRKIPAVTRADTGVGAAIAAGSHLE